MDPNREGQSFSNAKSWVMGPLALVDLNHLINNSNTRTWMRKPHQPVLR